MKARPICYRLSHRIHNEKQEAVLVYHASRSDSGSRDRVICRSDFRFGDSVLASSSRVTNRDVLPIVRFPMLPFCLYFVAAIITGFQVYSLLTLAVYGVPFNLLHLASLLGSLCLLVAAYVSLFRPHAAAKLALLACLGMWCFYGPATANLIRTKLHKTSVSDARTGPRDAPTVGAHSIAERPASTRCVAHAAG